MTTLLAELHEHQATGRIAEIYEEIRRFSGVLEWAWDAVRPALASGAIRARDQRRSSIVSGGGQGSSTGDHGAVARIAARTGPG